MNDSRQIHRSLFAILAQMFTGIGTPLAGTIFNMSVRDTFKCQISSHEIEVFPHMFTGVDTPLAGTIFYV